MRFKTSNSLQECHAAHPGEKYMIKAIKQGEDDSMLIIFHNKRLLSSVLDIYEKYVTACEIYAYDRRYKHGRYTVKTLKIKAVDKRFCSLIKKEEPL